MGGAAYLLVIAILGLWAAGRNDLLVTIAHTLTANHQAYLCWTYALGAAAIVSMMLYGLWCDKGFPRFLRDESGQDGVEYALLAGFIAMNACALFPELIRSGFAAVGEASITTIRIVCAVVAVLLVVLIVRRRRRISRRPTD